MGHFSRVITLPMVLVLLAEAILGSSAFAANVDGPARVLDGDTIEIQGQKIRIFGIDAPEGSQRCATLDNNPYDCAGIATRFVNDMVKGKIVSCVQRDYDRRYNRLVAQCKVGALDIGQELVRAGHAVAYRRYSTAYIRDEDEARLDKRGMWAGRFDYPWDVRAGLISVVPVLVAAPSAGNAACQIKGNINRRGDRIYHVPGSRDYSRTIISEGSGERWFCSVEEAIAAGWRAPRIR